MLQQSPMLPALASTAEHRSAQLSVKSVVLVEVVSFSVVDVEVDPEVLVDVDDEVVSK